MDLIGLYPTWYEPMLGSGWIIGIIATVHVLFSHTAVGAAILFGVLAWISARDNRPELIEFIKKYGLFLLVFSYILGSITGPGIWYSTSVGSPRGISSLIHNFVWKWATEWLFFVIEVVGVYMLVYMADKLERRTYMKVAITFSLTSFTTMLAIVGILSFQMGPGKEAWFTEGGYLLGYYGENTLAQVLIRSAFMFTMAAVVGGIVAAGLKDQALKTWILRRAAAVGIISTLVGMALYPWYIGTYPEIAHLVMDNRLPAYFVPSILTVLGAILAYFVVTLIKPKLITASVAVIATVAILVLGLWPGESIRESARKPYVAGQYLYSNQVIGRDVPGMGVASEIPTLEKVGFTQAHVFWPEAQREITRNNAADVGRTLAITACSACHSLTETGIRPLKNYFPDKPEIAQVKTYLLGALATGNTMYMPQIPLKEDEAEALAVYIASLSDPEAIARYKTGAKTAGLETQLAEEVE